jgi:TonB-dependent starch-binding outer membrane protein SusC
MGKIHLVFLLFGLFSIQLMGQTGTITGVVTDQQTGETLPGANVVIQGTTTGAVTDFDGRYTFSAPAGTVTLVASFIGYDPQSREVTIREGEVINVNFALSQDVALLEEFIVIGYGIQRREDATGSVAVVDSRDFNRGNITTATELLAGKAPGLQITTAGGAPGSSASIRIRGGASLQASNDPLIVIDGVPVATEGIVGMRNPLSTLNPNDIESFTILKDASAAAIYGSRASNGVIIITTKKGAAGAPMQLSYVGNYSLSTAANRVNVLSADRFRQVMNERYATRPDILNMIGNDNTNWQDQIFTDAFGQDHTLTLSGSYRTLPYRFSLGYSDHDGILRTDNLNRTTMSMALNPSLLDDHLKVEFNARGTRVNNVFADNGAIGAAIQFDPTQPVTVGLNQPAGVYGGYFAWIDPGTNLPRAVVTPNPVALLELREDISMVDRLQGNVKFDYSLHWLPELRANLNLAYDYSQTDGSVHIPDYAAWAYFGGGTNNRYEQEKKNELMDFYLNYNTDMPSNSRLDVMAGYSYQRFWRRGASENRNIRGNIGGVDFLRTTTSYESESILISFFGRVNYNLMDRYLFTATLRNDGSSKFRGDNQWGLFPSAAFAWKILNESFMDNVDFLSEFKLRLGYGITGQQAITDNDYPALPRYTYNIRGAYYQFGDDFVRTLRPEGYDANLKWEETTTYNAGIDFGFAQDRYYGSIDVYFRETRDLINTIPVPAGTNLTNFILTNIGNMENRGVEFNIYTRPLVTRDFNWLVGFNATWNETKITRLTLIDDPTYAGILVGGIAGGVGNTIQVHSVGHAPNTFFVFQQVYDPAGNPIEGIYVDRNNDGSISDDDRYRFKTPVPTYFFGLTSDLQYREWTLALAGRANIGNFVYNNVSSMNGELSRLHRPEGPYLSNITPEALEIGFQNAQYISDFYIRDASFFKMDNISLAYNFGNVFGSRTNLSVTGTVQNAFVITRYDGLDPEVLGGIDNNIYPRPRNFVLSVNLQL